VSRWAISGMRNARSYPASSQLRTFATGGAEAFNESFTAVTLRIIEQKE
jgi:hypothetical protein